MTFTAKIVVMVDIDGCPFSPGHACPLIGITCFRQQIMQTADYVGTLNGIAAPIADACDCIDIAFLCSVDQLREQPSIWTIQIPPQWAKHWHLTIEMSVCRSMQEE